jgi:hypothetical protein
MKLFLKFLLLLPLGICAQDDTDLLNELSNEKKPKREYVEYTFKTTRVINAHSIETIKGGAMDFRVSHRFGNIADANAGHTIIGFDQSTDILIAFEMGVTDRLQLGIGRTKGYSHLKELYNGSLKYKLYRQTKDNKHPLSITLNANACISSMTSDTSSQFYNFEGNNKSVFAHRWTYMAQGIFARKFSEGISIELIPTYIHRNIVESGDVNDLFSMGVAGRFKLAKRFGIVFDAFIPISKGFYNRSANDAKYYIPLGLGIEWETGGHVFHLNFSNSAGILENDFIPYSSNNWLDGQFRIGFTISRVFQIF